MRLDEIDYDLPAHLIAQEPLAPRDAARLMVVDRAAGTIAHHHFGDLPALLAAGDLLVVNDSRVLPARLHGHKVDGGGAVELLLLREVAADTWEALVRPGRRLPPGCRVALPDGVSAVCGARLPDGCRQVAFAPAGRLRDVLDQIGEMPLPPYIHRRLAVPERYQTVYAAASGSAAAPTAGLHFTPALLERLSQQGVRRANVTLHVGLDTFRPVQCDRVEDHPMHSEAWWVGEDAAAAIQSTKARGGRVVAVGTTAVRTLETAAAATGAPQAGRGWTRLFILPGYRFRVVDALVTNFHLPRTTLIAMVSAFAGADLVREAYQQAMAARYRMLSFGDAMLIL